MQALAKELAVVLIVPLFERQAPGVYRNSAAVIDADGALLGVYRKMHIPDDPLFYEKYYFAPGDTTPDRGAPREAEGFKVWKTRYATIGVLICWDQWYPEAARITSLLGAQVLFYPTAIGWHPDEKDEWGQAQVDAWRTAQRAHAIANGVYVAAPNRIGHEDEPGTDGITFFGHSFICDPFGRYVAEAGEGRADPHGPLRSRPHRDGAAQLAVPPRSPYRRVRSDPQPVSRLVSRSAAADAGRVGAASRHLDQLAPSRAGLARQARRRFPGSTPRSPACSPITSRSRSCARPSRCARPLTQALDAHGVRRDRVRLHIVPTDRVLAPRLGAHRRARRRRPRRARVVGVQRLGEVRQLHPRRARRPRHRRHHGAAASKNRAAQTTAAASSSKAAASRSTAQGLMLVTEEWLLSDVQVRNPGLTRADYEAIFREWLGITRDDLAGRRLRRRRHARPRRRHRPFRLPKTSSCSPSRRSGRREPRAVDRQPPPAGTARRRSRPLRDRDAPVSRGRC